MSMSSLLPLTSTFTSLPSTNSQFNPLKTRPNQNWFKVSCNVAPPNDDNQNQLILPEQQKLILPNNNVDRRNLLVGLGGLYTAANLTSLPSAFAAPITSPDITSVCKDSALGIGNLEKAVRTNKCCPPALGKKIKPFVFPSKSEKVRMRWPAQKGTKEQIAKYKKAIQAMRDLPDEHPHSFVSQAKIHCAYCNGGYTQVENGFPEIDLQIHNSWLFFPFHRWYLYFYERILGNLINDPTFALPYWNWDDPAGMTIPEFMVSKDNDNPLYDVYRDPRHQPPNLLDLAFDGTDRDTTAEIQTKCNLYTVYRDLVRNGGDSTSFFGGDYVAGDEPVANNATSIGSVESGTHTAVHRWVGDSNQPNGEDMGNFYSAGYDPVFYVHHANVDRMWKLWKELGIPGHVEPTKPDWLNASYVFYDENQELVRVYNKDSVSPDKLRFNYIENTKSDLLSWRQSRPDKRSKKILKTPKVETKTADKIKFPVGIVPLLKVKVKRPAVNRTEAEKAKANEVLLINGIKFNSDKFVKFDVFVNDNVEEGEDIPDPCSPEYAGGFSQVPHGKMKKMLMTSAARFGLNELLEDTKTEDEEYATVVLVARTGCEGLTISGLKIVLVPVA
ncbi:polyphenol oxidase I, chloroplastic-like [Rutidosis leptorrhynchoides]|uniref:polyphenol oxidase I, chloroplastic-like n=1 Tax=Rutidosis leptorrhynchoides TaxID=125765 RepID=UPI003A994028